MQNRPFFTLPRGRFLTEQISELHFVNDFSQAVSELNKKYFVARNRLPYLVLMCRWQTVVTQKPACNPPGFSNSAAY
jgi:hypothetical protein